MKTIINNRVPNKHIRMISEG